eukprot:450651-Pyramimonas_sp.AAC.1
MRPPSAAAEGRPLCDGSAKLAPRIGLGGCSAHLQAVVVVAPQCPWPPLQPLRLLHQPLGR